jgi:hypothetical protein
MKYTIKPLVAIVLTMSKHIEFQDKDINIRLSLLI